MANDSNYAKQGYRRVVTSINHLREKLAIINSGLVDRLVELYKYSLNHIYSKDLLSEGAKIPEIDIYFFSKPDGIKGFEIYSDGVLSKKVILIRMCTKNFPKITD